jgi:hypothetical protein
MCVKDWKRDISETNIVCFCIWCSRAECVTGHSTTIQELRYNLTRFQCEFSTGSSRIEYDHPTFKDKQSNMYAVQQDTQSDFNE